MHPTLVREPFHRPGWVFERKEDGWRMLAYKEGGAVRLVSRRGVDHTAQFADIAAAVAKLPARTLILDGEVCVFDARLVSQFHLLGDSSTGELATPPVFIAFDLLRFGARDLRARPLAYRRPALEDAIAGSRFVLLALRLEADAFGAWQQVKRSGWEGLVAKDNASSHVGGATRSWLKVKVRHEGRFVIVGLDVPLAGSCSLLLAARVGRRLVYAVSATSAVESLPRCLTGYGAYDTSAPESTADPVCGLGRAVSRCKGSVQRNDARPPARSRATRRQSSSSFVTAE